MPSLLPQSVLSGFLLGGYYALIAVGLALLFGVMGVINLSHGEFVVLGGYIGYWLFRLLGFNPLLSLTVAAAILALVGLVVQRFLVQAVREAPELNTLILTFGLGIFLANLMLELWTADFRTIETPWMRRGVSFVGLRASLGEVVAFGVSLLLIGLLHLFLTRTDLGIAIRATSHDREAASLMGIDVRRVDLVAFAIAAASGGAAGPLLGSLYYVFPQAGGILTLKAFVITVMGGVGSILGVILASLILGVAESLTVTLSSASYREMVAFVLFIAVLLLRPSGLLGREEMR